MKSKTKTFIIFGVTMIIIFVTFLSLFFYAIPQKFRAEIKKFSTQYDIEPELIASIINAESRYNPGAKSSAGAIGLMQLLPSTAFWVAQENGLILENEQQLYEVEKNIEIACCYLSLLFKEFNNIENVLSAYNAGPSYARLWLKNPNYSPNGNTIQTTPFPETTKYIQKVKRYQIYYSYFW